MTYKPSLVPVLLLCLCLSPCVGADVQAAPAQAHSAPTNYDGTPLFLPTEWQRMQAIQSHLEATRTLPVADMDYAVHLLRTPPPKNTPWLTYERQMFVLAQLTSTRPKNLTPPERRHLFDVVLPYTDSPGVVVRTNAMLVLTSSRDPRAVAVLERHVRADTNPQNRTIAAKFLQRLRFVLGQSADRSPQPEAAQ